MRYVLATTEKVVRWYVFDPKTVSSTTYSLNEVLDLNSNKIIFIVYIDYVSSLYKVLSSTKTLLGPLVSKQIL